MTVIGIVLGAIIVVLVLLLIFNKPFLQQLLIKFRGRTDEIMRQDASTPEAQGIIIIQSFVKKKIYITELLPHMQKFLVN